MNEFDDKQISVMPDKENETSNDSSSVAQGSESIEKALASVEEALLNFREKLGGNTFKEPVLSDVNNPCIMDLDELNGNTPLAIAEHEAAFEKQNHNSEVKLENPDPSNEIPSTSNNALLSTALKDGKEESVNQTDVGLEKSQILPSPTKSLPQGLKIALKLTEEGSSEKQTTFLTVSPRSSAEIQGLNPMDLAFRNHEISTEEVVNVTLRAPSPHHNCEDFESPIMEIMESPEVLNMKIDLGLIDDILINNDNPLLDNIAVVEDRPGFERIVNVEGGSDQVLEKGTFTDKEIPLPLLSEPDKFLLSEFSTSEKAECSLMEKLILSKFPINSEEGLTPSISAVDMLQLKPNAFNECSSLKNAFEKVNTFQETPSLLSNGQESDNSCIHAVNVDVSSERKAGVNANNSLKQENEVAASQEEKIVSNNFRNDVLENIDHKIKDVKKSKDNDAESEMTKDSPMFAALAKEVNNGITKESILEEMFNTRNKIILDGHDTAEMFQETALARAEESLNLNVVTQIACEEPVEAKTDSNLEEIEQEIPSLSINTDLESFDPLLVEEKSIEKATFSSEDLSNHSEAIKIESIKEDAIKTDTKPTLENITLSNSANLIENNHRSTGHILTSDVKIDALNILSVTAKENETLYSNESGPEKDAAEGHKFNMITVSSVDKTAEIMPESGMPKEEEMGILERNPTDIVIELSKEILHFKDATSQDKDDEATNKKQEISSSEENQNESIEETANKIHSMFLEAAAANSSEEKTVKTDSKVFSKTISQQGFANTCLELPTESSEKKHSCNDDASPEFYDVQNLSLQEHLQASLDTAAADTYEATSVEIQPSLVLSSAIASFIEVSQEDFKVLGKEKPIMEELKVNFTADFPQENEGNEEKQYMAEPSVQETETNQIDVKQDPPQASLVSKEVLVKALESNTAEKEQLFLLDGKVENLEVEKEPSVAIEKEKCADQLQILMKEEDSLAEEIAGISVESSIKDCLKANIQDIPEKKDIEAINDTIEEKVTEVLKNNEEACKKDGIKDDPSEAKGDNDGLPQNAVAIFVVFAAVFLYLIWWR